MAVCLLVELGNKEANCVIVVITVVAAASWIKALNECCLMC